MLLMKMEEIDKNFKTVTKIEKEGIKFYNIQDEPFKIYGVKYENGLFRRIPEDVAKSVSEGVYALHTKPVGGRVRFKTDSKYVAVSLKVENVNLTAILVLTGVASCDIYADNIFKGTYRTPFEVETEYEGVLENVTDGTLKNITIGLPNHAFVREMYVGLDENARLLPPEPYKIETPVVYYGSSITQGCCSSRPGMSYEAIVARRLDCNYINLGFAGNAKGEDAIAHYIKGLKMSAFVYDYDHNAPTPEHLEATHERMFKIIREAQPALPVVMMPRPKMYLNDEEKKRREIVIKTYENALKSGDKNVYYIDNTELIALCGNEGTLEGLHPSDFGFNSMAKAVGDCLEKILF
ncbi:MAG: hypothetical protein II744_01430 [Eubacterium sp.]|nr:hypothetical protein [Eubacterium sp.]